MKDTLRKNEVLGYFNLDQILNKRRKKTIKRIRYTTYIYTSPCISLAYILHISTCSIRMNIEWIFHISGTQFFFPSILQNFHPPSPSLSHSFHHAIKKKKEEGKLLKREEKSWKRKGGKRERKSNKPSLLSSPTTLSPSTIPSTPNLPLLPDTRPSSRFFFSSTILLFSFTCTCTTTAITTISNCVFVGANTTKAPDTARLFERAPSPQLRLYRNNVGTKSLLCRHTNPARRFTTKFH